MGHYSQYIIDHLQGLDAILLEANHDVKMLEAGPYPYYLKRRILGDYGHLSNENAGRLLSSILHDNLKHIFLGHLSKENNYEELAMRRCVWRSQREIRRIRRMISRSQWQNAMQCRRL